MSPDQSPPSSSDQPARKLDPTGELQDLLRRASENDPEAANLLFHRFQAALLAAIRRILNYPLRRVYDSDDFSNMAWTTLLAEVRNGKQFDNPPALAAFLQEIAKRDVLGTRRFHIETQKRSLRREESAGAHGREEDPAETAAARDELARLFGHLSERDRTFFESLLNGTGLEELARLLGLSMTSLRVLLRRRAGLSAVHRLQPA